MTDFILSPLLLATYNMHKAAELRQALPTSIKLYTVADFDGVEPEEDGHTFQENAALKAIYWHDRIGYACLADDSGLCIDALEGAPGVQSKDFLAQHGGLAATFNFLQAQASIQQNPRAVFVCVLALALPRQELIFFEGHCAGRLVFPSRGHSGHGYDPIFQPDNSSKTFAEMEALEKHTYSHRGRAVALLKQFLEDNV